MVPVTDRHRTPHSTRVGRAGGPGTSEGPGGDHDNFRNDDVDVDRSYEGRQVDQVPVKEGLRHTGTAQRSSCVNNGPHGQALL